MGLTLANRGPATGLLTVLAIEPGGCLMMPGPGAARTADASPLAEHGAARPGNERSGLRSYRDRRLELGDMPRAALHLAHSRGDAGA